MQHQFDNVRVVISPTKWLSAQLGVSLPIEENHYPCYEKPDDRGGWGVRREGNCAYTAQHTLETGPGNPGHDAEVVNPGRTLPMVCRRRKPRSSMPIRVWVHLGHTWRCDNSACNSARGKGTRRKRSPLCKEKELDRRTTAHCHFVDIADVALGKLTPDISLTARRLGENPPLAIAVELGTMCLLPLREMSDLVA